jgi:hypothetical protein
LYDKLDILGAQVVEDLLNKYLRPTCPKNTLTRPDGSLNMKGVELSYPKAGPNLENIIK